MKLGKGLASMIQTYRTTGKLGGAKPSTVAKARKQALMEIAKEGSNDV